MKEIELKLDELNKKIDNVELSMKNIKEHIEFLKEKEMNYLDWEEQLNTFKYAKIDLENKISILNNALDILSGIGV